jgi:hypothetical protein
VGTDGTASERRIAGKQAERWQQIRRLAKLISAVIGAIGVAAAGIGYITNGVRFFSGVTEYFQGQSELRSLIETADERLTRSDFEAAWLTNTKVRRLAPRSAAAKMQQANVAMKWLENVQLSSGRGPQTFGDVVDPLKSALIERLADTHGRERADLLAHIGWANFLRYRDGRPKADIIEEFDAAIKEDPNNLYGHVMRGFWILWDGGSLERARGDFELALRSAADPTYSDSLIMSALTNRQSDEFIAAAIEYANTIRRAGRNIDDRSKSRLGWYYSNCLQDMNLLARISRTLPAAEHILFLDWLKQANMALHEKRAAAYCMAYFAESDGKREDALKLYSDLISTSPAEGEDIARLALAAVGRLQKR